MSRKTLFIAVAALALVLLAGGGAYYVLVMRPAGGSAPAAPGIATIDASGAAAPQPAPAGKLPDPVFLVLDRAAVRRFSKVGQDISRQVQALADQARRDLSVQQAQLENDIKAYQAASATLTPEQRTSRADALQKRQVALQAAAQRKDAQLTATAQEAYVAVDKVMAPVMEQVVKARGGNLVLDRTALPYAQPSMDITPEVIAQLDAKMPSHKVVLAQPK